MLPSGRLLQPAAGRAPAVTAASTAPLRSQSEVWSSSSTATCISTGAWAANAAMTGANQVARLSAFTATGSATRATPSGASAGSVPCSSSSSRLTRSTCWHRRRLVRHAMQGH